MNAVELLAELRQRIGKPPIDEVSNEELLGFLSSAYERVAEVLAAVIRTDETSMVLTANTQSYALPGDFITMIWAEWDGKKLAPASTYLWERRGLDWRDQAAGNPSEYAIQGRNLILYPKPSSDAVSEGSEITYRYVGTADGIHVDGARDLGDADQWLVVYHAAMEWLGTHPGKTREEREVRGVMYATNKDQYEARLADAERRAACPIEDFYPTIAVKSRRSGAAR